jgi:hypothetical protein
MAFINIKFTAFITKNLGKPIKQFYTNHHAINVALNRQGFLLALGETPGFWGLEPFSSKYYFRTDDRLFGEMGSHRLQLAGNIDLSKIGSSEFYQTQFFLPHTSESERYEIEYDVNDNQYIYNRSKRQSTPEHLVEEVYPTFNNFFTSKPNNVKCVTIRKATSAAYPFTPQWLTPSIDMELKIILFKNSNNVRCVLMAEHNRFPNYELLFNGKTLYRYDPKKFNELQPGVVNLSQSILVTKKIDILITS